MISRKNEIGSAHIAIIMLLVLAILGLVGFVSWRSFVQKEAPTQPASSNLVNPTSNDSEKSSEDKYLVLSDWGVKFKLPELKSELVSRKVEDEFGSYYEFTTKRVKELCASSGAESKGYTLGSIARTTTKDEEHVGSVAINNNDPVGGYYYYVSAPQSRCSSDSEDIQAEDRSLILKMLSSPFQET